jgi:hypothetical protein
MQNWAVVEHWSLRNRVRDEDLLSKEIEKEETGKRHAPRFTTAQRDLRQLE